MAGKVWQWIIPSNDLPGLKQKHLISGVVRHDNGVQVRVVSDCAPTAEAQLITPSLEDAYLHLVSQNGAKP